MSGDLYPIAIYSSAGELIDRAGNVESAESILYGDLSAHDGHARVIFAPPQDVGRLESLARINADCWDIPVDSVHLSEHEHAHDFEDARRGAKP